MTAGPPVSLQPSVAQTLALALHELATNAAKYGALSVDTGTLRMTWEVKGETLFLEWTESGAPATMHASPRGFGMKLISTSIDQQLCGQVKFDWDARGLRCAISIPLHKSEERSLEKAAKWNEVPIPDDQEQLLGPRVLLVEDEALVAMMMQEFLIGLGCAVVGPFTATAAALAAARDESVDFAVLDINLGGELVYPVADVLAWRGVPFVFVTGYDVDSIDERFKYVTTLQKPITKETLQKILTSQVKRSPFPNHAPAESEHEPMTTAKPRRAKIAVSQAMQAIDPSKVIV
jgi:CheY-like chemotaxis protein